MRQLWQHQQDGIDGLRGILKNGVNRVVLGAPTGSGKTLMSAAVIDSALAKGKRIAFVVSSLSLIDQTIEALAREGIRDVGVIQANHLMTDWAKPVQIVSIQTLASKRNKGSFPRADLVIFDEVHSLHKQHKEWLNHPDWEKVPFIGLSATPGTRGLGKYFSELLTIETTQGLIDKGILSPFKVFATGHPDLSGVKTVAGDYHEGQLSDAMQRGTLTADIVDTWKQRHGTDKTLVFCVDRAHAQQIQARFVEMGISCGYQDAKTPADERREIKRKFHSGEFRVVSNVGTLTTGTDWDVRCLILARPTKSEMLYVQIIGRALRTAPGKAFALILDHSDTTKNLGFVTDIKFSELDTGKPPLKAKVKPKSKKTLECPKCTAIFALGEDTCWNCGEVIQKRISGLIERDGELVEVSAGKRPNMKAVPPRVYSGGQKAVFYSSLLGYAVKKGYKPGFAAMKFKEKFGHWPNGYSKTPIEPTMEVLSWLKHKQIIYAMARSKNERNGQRA